MSHVVPLETEPLVSWGQLHLICSYCNFDASGGRDPEVPSAFLHRALHLLLLRPHTLSVPFLTLLWGCTRTLSAVRREILMTLFSNPQLKRNNHVPTNYPPFVPLSCWRTGIGIPFPYKCYLHSLQSRLGAGWGKWARSFIFLTLLPSKRLQCLQGKPRLCWGTTLDTMKF